MDDKLLNELVTRTRKYEKTNQSQRGDEEIDKLQEEKRKDIICVRV